MELTLRLRFTIFGGIMRNEPFYHLPNPQIRKRIVLKNGIYLVKRPIIDVKVGEHYGVMVCGETLQKFGFSRNRSIIIHKTDKGIFPVWADISGDWYFVNKVPINQIGGVIDRINTSLVTPQYHLIFSNCEHFARFVTEGSARSTQVQTVGVATAVLALLWLNND